VIIIADGHELPIGAGHRNEQTSGTPQADIKQAGSPAQASPGCGTGEEPQELPAEAVDRREMGECSSWGWLSAFASRCVRSR